MASENPEKASEGKANDSAESKAAESCTRECLQFEWLNNMGTRLPGTSDGGKKAPGLSDLTLTPDGKSADDSLSKAHSDPEAKAGEAPSRGAEQSGKPGKDNAESASDAHRPESASTRDVRQEIIHLAEYGHCSFADKNEYRETLDKVLKEFSEKPDVSERNKQLQGMISEFLKNPTQEGYAQFYKQFNAFFMESGRQAMETAKVLDAEKAKNMTPERQAAEADTIKKSDEFFKSLDKLPKEEKDRIMCLLDWQDEVSKEERNARVREGLANHPKLLEAFNASQAANDKSDAMRSPREVQLAETHRQQVRDNILARAITKLMLHRSRI